ncbi:hypothetical protein [Egicoccus sp. AB-alg2]|uniref:DUF6929 family protein n=1 Tax=Egicoccus sp. AB-alg2 TaxID=3242693 RepID=UPI00359D734E
MAVELVSMERLQFGPGGPVRAASALARFGDGWLVAQDDANHAAWWRPDSGTIERIRLLPARDGLDVFGDADGTKHLKPDFEAACDVATDPAGAVLLLGSGSLPRRTRGVLVRAMPDCPLVRSADLAPLYERVRHALGLRPTQLNLEGACVVGDRMRWFQRGHGPTGVASASVDLPLHDLLATIEEGRPAASVEIGDVRRYEFGTLCGQPLAITDAVLLPDGRICVSATAEDAPDAIADGPVAGSVLGLLDGGGGSVEILPLDEAVAGCKVEGLAVLPTHRSQLRLLAVVDEDDPTVGSIALTLGLGEVAPG